MPALSDLIIQRDRSRASLQAAFHTFHNQGTRGFELRQRARVQAKGANLRDSINYRLDSLLFHLDVLEIVQEDTFRRLQSALENEPPTSLRHRSIMRDGAIKQRYLFDDLAFAVVSTFDYFGNFVGLAHYGESRSRMKWRRLIQYARDSALETRDHHSTRIHESAAASAALALDADWLKELTEYRANAIHYRADEIDGHLTIDWMKSEPLAAFESHVPAEFVLRLSRAPVRPPNLAAGAPLIPCAEWLIENTLVRVTGLADALAGDILAGDPGRASGGD